MCTLIYIRQMLKDAYRHSSSQANEKLLRDLRLVVREMTDAEEKSNELDKLRARLTDDSSMLTPDTRKRSRQYQYDDVTISNPARKYVTCRFT